jgi:hypothetical protein
LKRFGFIVKSVHIISFINDLSPSFYHNMMQIIKE